MSHQSFCGIATRLAPEAHSMGRSVGLRRDRPTLRPTTRSYKDLIVHDVCQMEPQPCGTNGTNSRFRLVGESGEASPAMSCPTSATAAPGPMARGDRLRLYPV